MSLQPVYSYCGDWGGKVARWGESSCLLLSPGKRRPPIKRTTALQRGQMVMAPPEQSQQQGWQMVPSLQKISGMSVQTRGDKVFGATTQHGLVNVLQMAVQKRNLKFVALTNFHGVDTLTNFRLPTWTRSPSRGVGKKCAKPALAGWKEQAPGVHCPWLGEQAPCRRGRGPANSWGNWCIFYRFLLSVCFCFSFNVNNQHATVITSSMTSWTQGWK